MYETIASPIEYGGIRLKNRIIFAPTTMGLKQEDYCEKIRQIAAGGCAMVILGDVPVARFGFGQSLFTSKGFAAYRELTDILHRENCLACAQLHQSDSNVKAMLKYVPGVLTKKISMQDLRPLLNQEVSPYICGLSTQKIRQITSISAARPSRRARRDLIWFRSTETGCWAASLPRYSITAPMNTAVPLKTVSALPWKR